MDELILGLGGLLCAATFLAVVGHGLWLLGAMILRAIFPGGERRASSNPRAEELGELAAMERRLDRFQSQGQVAESSANEVRAAIGARREQLEPAADPFARPRTMQDVYLRDLQQVLSQGKLIGSERQRAVVLFDQLTKRQVLALPASSRFDLAFVLEKEGRISDALAVLNDLLEQYPSHGGTTRTALAALKMAVAHDRRAEAEQLIQQEFNRDLSPEEARELESLRQAIQVRVESELEKQSAVPIAEVSQEPDPIDSEASLPTPIKVAEDVPSAPLDSSQATPSLTQSENAATDAASDEEIAWVEEPTPPEKPTPPMVDAPSFAEPASAASPLDEVAETSPETESILVIAAESIETKEPAEPPVPRRTLAELLASFMEERNIRWGELVGGLLIVGCSIALVVSLRETLQAVPYFQFLIFGGVTATMFAFGLYTERQWKLEATSRGLLIIASLLTPLNFVALVKLSASAAAGGLLSAAMEIGVLLAFAALVYLAAAVLAPSARSEMTLGVMGASGLMLLVGRLIETDSSLWLLMSVCGLMTVCHGIAVGWPTRKLLRQDSATATDAGELFALLGTISFATLTGVGLLLFQINRTGATLDHLAIFAPLIAMPIAACGLTARRKLSDKSDDAAWRTAGSTVGLIGMLLMLVGVAVAWPVPADMVVVSVVNAVGLAALAFRFQLPVAHAGVAVCLFVAYLTGFHLVWGSFPMTDKDELAAEISRLFLAPRSGTALVGLFAMLAVAGELIARTGWRKHGAYYSAAAGIVACFSLTIVTWSGTDDALRAALVFATYGGGCLAVNVRWRRPSATYLGLALLLGANGWALQSMAGPFSPDWTAVLAAHLLIMGAVASWIRVKDQGRKPTDASKDDATNNDDAPSWTTSFGDPLAIVSELASWAVLILAAAAGWQSAQATPSAPWPFAHVVTGSCLTVLYLLLVHYRRRAEMGVISGVLLVGSVIVATGWLGARFEVGDPLMTLAAAAAMTSAFLVGSAMLFMNRP
ncbi:MAG: hypothetical protein N2C14_12105, partial [Planctomycetales bacterium]